MVYQNSLLNGDGIKVTQDIIHICSKGRNRLLKFGIKLPMGMHEVSVGHLKTLVKNVQKSVHGLTFSDVFPIDRMNYGSFEKIVQDRVISALRDRIPGSDATVQYLLTFRDIANSFLLFDLKPLDRLFLIWRGLFFLRIWRAFIRNSRSYTLGENFITHNTYTCVEINAKNLLHLIKEFRDCNAPEMFLPALFDSQTCERTFRIFRSMGTTQFTKINFGLLELIHMIGRVEVANDIAYCKLNIDGIELPHKRKGKTTIYPLPTDGEIHETITKAKEEAIQKAEFFGMTFNDTNQIDEYKFISKLTLNETMNGADNVASEEGYSDDEVDEHSTDYSLEYHEACHEDNEKLDEFESWNINPSGDLDVNSPLTMIEDENGVQKTVLKSTLVWVLTEPGLKMSNDRSKRFKISSKSNALKRKANNTY